MIKDRSNFLFSSKALHLEVNEYVVSWTVIAIMKENKGRDSILVLFPLYVDNFRTKFFIMGNSWVREMRDGTAQMPGSVTPEQDSKPTFDPMIGFPNGRVPRVLNVSAEEMEAVQLQPWEKNYCADLHIKVKTNS